MPANYVLLEKITVGAAGASSVTFNSIPQSGYTDLCIKMSTRANADTVSSLISFNGLTTNLSVKNLYGNGASAGSTSFSDARLYGDINSSTRTASTFANGEIYIPNYAGSAYKSISADAVEENNGTTAFAGLSAALWSATSAITSITLTPQTGSYVQYSTFSLYGVAALGTTPAIAPKATGGDIIQTDGTYWYHAFLSSGTFTPATGLSCDVLQIAGGGGGGSLDAGGGGAGGISYLTSQAVTASAKTITVGAGGAGGSGGFDGASGTNSQFASLTAAVGGGAGGGGTQPGYTGGSGGGGGYSGAGGAATSGQGNAGGAGVLFSGYAGGGGGGGAGSAGVACTSTAAGNGGAGTNTYSTWASATSTGVSGYYAGGGGGGGDVRGTTDGAAGSGGATAGNRNATASSATANTGSGAGGGGYNYSTQAGGAGGSGIVIVRYAI